VLTSSFILVHHFACGKFERSVEVLSITVSAFAPTNTMKRRCSYRSRCLNAIDIRAKTQYAVAMTVVCNRRNKAAFSQFPGPLSQVLGFLYITIILWSASHGSSMPETPENAGNLHLFTVVRRIGSVWLLLFFSRSTSATHQSEAILRAKHSRGIIESNHSGRCARNRAKRGRS
jgi:hypothetical protein